MLVLSLVKKQNAMTKTDPCGFYNVFIVWLSLTLCTLYQILEEARPAHTWRDAQ